MDIRRVVLYAALGLTIFSLWTAWQKDYPAVAVQQVSQNPDAVNTSDSLLPVVKEQTTDTQNTATETEKLAQDNESKSISVKTDVLDLVIDTRHGDIVNAKLLKFPLNVDNKDIPFTLFQNQSAEKYVANSSLFTSTGQSVKNYDFHFTANKDSYEMVSNENDLIVMLNGKTDSGLDVKKEFKFNRGSYQIQVNYLIENKGTEAWKGYMNTQILRSSPQEDKSSIFHVGSYTGASYSNPPKHKYQKVSFKQMTKDNLDLSVDGGWVAMQQHYFLSAWIPAKDSKNLVYTRSADNDFTIGAVSPVIIVEPSSAKSISATLYVGPEDTTVLKDISPGLELTVDYGWLWFLSSLLFTLMKSIHSVVGNWGWSIVIVTVLIKLAFFRLSATSYKSMAGMRKLQPKLLALRERYGDDKAKMSQATMELYRQEKVNPLGGCLPIIVQIPVFIALYWVLLESVQLRQAPFIFWINDLAAADPYHILPIIMGATMLIQQRLNPAPPDPMQAKVMMMLPFVFTALFWSFPSGLVLYWIVNNTLSILQQWYITRKYGDDRPAKVISSVK